MRHIAIIIGLACIASEALPQSQEVVFVKSKPVALPEIPVHTPVIDTVRRTFIVFTKIPGMLFTKDGYCVRKNYRCIRAHLDNSKRAIKLPVNVLGEVDEEPHVTDTMPAVTYPPDTALIKRIKKMADEIRKDNPHAYAVLMNLASCMYISKEDKFALACASINVDLIKEWYRENIVK